MTTTTEATFNATLDALYSIQNAIETIGVAPARITIRGDQRVDLGVGDCDSYAKYCDHYDAKRDDGRWSATANHRIYDALTKDGQVLIEHRCWRHLPCWKDTP